MTKPFEYINFICIFICFLSLSVVVSSSVVTRKITYRYKSVDINDHHSLTCTCSNNSTTEKDIDRIMVKEILNGSLNCFAVKEICMLLQFCENCNLKSESCQPLEEEKYFECEKNVYILKENILDDNNFGNNSAYHLRTKRSDGVCPFPPKLKTAAVACKIWNEKVECKQTCIIGHTLKEGSSLKYTCIRKENKWKPCNFKECKPYVDCTAKLKSGGTLGCTTATTKSNPRCDIECHEFEDKKAVPKRSYTCNKHGKWNRKLPFCAVAGSNIKLVDPPKEN